ncbi:MAG: DUF1501 domain-containing protein [Alphaproteobacteria bacterium]|nr:DUF1501 domain-containing protein [Alphaproteobacteria bacterium]
MGSPLAASLSFTQKHDRAWAGLRTRTSTPRVAFDGTPLDGSLNLTRIEALQMEEARALRTSAGNEADRLLEGLHDSLAQSSIVLANNVVDVISATPGFEHLTSQGPLYSQKVACLEGSSSCWGWTDGSMGQIDTALKVLKSGLASSVTYRAVGPDSINGFDTHNGGAPDGGVGFAYSSTRARALLEEIGRLLIEMQLTPGAATGCSLLDETLVYICSDFGRSFPLAGDDHHPATVAILVGGGVQGNTMVGGWNESVPVGSSPMGLATAVTEEDGSAATRLLRAQDVAATVLYGLGLDPKKDFFLPGGYGVVKGVFG